MPYELIFIIPFVVGVVYRAIKYEEEMSGIIDQTRHEFDVIEKDEILYIVPMIPREEHRD